VVASAAAIAAGRCSGAADTCPPPLDDFGRRSITGPFALPLRLDQPAAKNLRGGALRTAGAEEPGEHHGDAGGEGHGEERHHMERGTDP